MESNLLRATKLRIIRELNDTIEQNPDYRDDIKVYHKFPYEERPMHGVILRNSSATRIKLSADDYAGDLKSHLTLAKAETYESLFLDWVWEDSTNMTDHIVEEDLSSQITGTSTVGTTRLFYTQYKPIIAGYNNTDIADNFRQVDITLDGEVIHADMIDGKKGAILIPDAPTVGQELKVSYYRSKFTPPGRYYVQLLDELNFVIDPMYVVDDELVIEKTTGIELTASLENSGIYGDFDVLYTKKTDFSEKIYLVKDTDYTLTEAGLITFLNALPSSTSLYASYRWVGTTMGPFPIPKDYEYDNTSLPGVVMSFGNQKIVGDKVVIIVYSAREPAAKVYSGHWSMSFDIEVFTRDPMELSDLTDFIVDDMWSRKRLKLITDGLTIEELNPTGEVEEPYDNNTTDLYYKNTINMVIMTEWQRFVPYLTKLLDYDTKLYTYMKNKDYIITNDNRVLELNVTPINKTFEVKYPKIGYPKIY